MAQPQLVNVKGTMLFPNIPYLPFTQGNIWHVKPSSGNDGNTGKRPDQAVKTLAKALSLATENQNDVVLLYAESNSAASTTDYQSSTLDWNKDMVHLVGVSSGVMYGQRARVALISTYDTASNLFTLSADGCIIAGIEFFAGVAGTSPTGCMQITGDRNYLYRCSIAGIGNDNNDIAGAYSLKLDGSDYTLIEECSIGVHTIARGTNANYEIILDGGCSGVQFRKCLVQSLIEHNTNHPQVYINDASAVGTGGLFFIDTIFYNFSVNDAYTNGGVFKMGAALTQGWVVIHNCMAVDASKWDVGDNDKIIVMHSPTPAADTAGIGRAV